MTVDNLSISLDMVSGEKGPLELPSESPRSATGQILRRCVHEQVVLGFRRKPYYHNGHLGLCITSPRANWSSCRERTNRDESRI